MPTTTQAATPLTSRIVNRLITKLKIETDYKWHSINNSGLVHYNDQGPIYLVKLLREKFQFEPDEAYEIVKECADVPLPAGFASSKRELERGAMQVVEYLAYWLLHEMIERELRRRGYQFS